MKLEISGHQTELTDDVKDYADQKIKKLDKYGINILNGFLSLEENHNKMEKTAGNATLVLEIAGKNIEATGQGENLYAAIDQVEEKAATQLRKIKEKTNDRGRLSRSKNLLRRLFRER